MMSKSFLRAAAASLRVALVGGRWSVTHPIMSPAGSKQWEWSETAGPADSLGGVLLLKRHRLVDEGVQFIRT
jgi:hypothetical protein